MKCLVLFATNVSVEDVAEDDNGQSVLPHIDSIVREGGSGLLEVQSPYPAGASAERACHSFESLLGLHSANPETTGTAEIPQKDAAAMALGERFRGMRGCLISPVEEIRKTGQDYGLTLPPRPIHLPVPAGPASTAQLCAERLGIVPVSGGDLFTDDIFLVHVDDSVAASTSLEWIDAFIKSYDQIPRAKAMTFTFFIAGPFKMPEAEAEVHATSFSGGGYSLQRPSSNAGISGGCERQFFVASRRLQNVVRRDAFHRLIEFSSFHKGAYATMPVNRLLPEIAYKLGHEPKYGA